ncbi:MAG: PD-(D/E)XK nuclease family protein [Candidatus Thalassarchaeaceae archaeon]|nr:PD-(D/E)XK nuclease family protein [Candidatus Thalassarchaeaceae archaeon]
MPVQIIDDDALLVSKFKRLSATSLIQYRGCPRSWYHQRIEFLRGPQVPAMMRGHIVENTVCRILRESPILVAEDDDWQILETPLDSDNRPDRYNPERYLAPDIEAKKGVEDLDSLRKWARARTEIHFPEVRESHVSDFEDHPMSIGSAEDFDDEQMISMINATLDFHLEEVQRCLAENGGPNLSQFRAGIRPQWPAPDGYPHNWSLPHPSVGNGDCTLMEAWEIARPWFVDPDAGTFSLGSIHPEHWFAGEYDFVYDWDGSISIVDLKAAMGNNDRSAGYVLQLEIYAWLWWETHGRTTRVENLRLWYAGVPAVKTISAPDENRLLELEKQLRTSYEDLFLNRSTNIEDYPAEPSPVQIFEAGGVHTGIDENPLARCHSCDHRSICPNGDDRQDLPSMENLQHAGRKWPITRATDLRTRVDICGEVTGLLSPQSDEDGNIQIKFNLQQGIDRIEIKNCFFPKPKRITRRIANGAYVRIKGGRPTEWNLNPSVELDDLSEIEIINAENADGEDIVDLVTAGSVVGRVMTIRDTTWHKNRTSSGKPKWRLTIQDATGPISIVAYSFAIPTGARSVRPGDDIAILNGVYSQFFDQPEIKFQKNTQLVILKRRED